MILDHPALDLLLQDKSNECKQRNSVGSHRISALAFPIFWVMHIARSSTSTMHLRVFQGVKGMRNIVSRQNDFLNMIEGVLEGNSFLRDSNLRVHDFRKSCAWCLTYFYKYKTKATSASNEKFSRLPLCFCSCISCIYDLAHSNFGDDIFSCSEEMAAREREVAG